MEALVIDPWLLASAMVVTLLAAMFQGSIGLGFSLICVPLFSLFDPRLAPGPQVILSLPLTLLIAWRERKAIELGRVANVVFGRFFGSLVGLWLLAVATQTLLELMVGVFVLASVLASVSVRTFPKTRWTELLAGLISGAAGIVSSIGGPPVGLLYQNEPGPTLRANLAAILAMGVIFSLVLRSAAGLWLPTDLAVAAWLLLPLLLGMWLSRFTMGVLQGPALRAAILWISGLAALALASRAGWVLSKVN